MNIPTTRPKSSFAYFDQQALSEFLNTASTTSDISVVAFDTQFDSASPLLEALSSGVIKNLYVVKRKYAENTTENFFVQSMVDESLVRKLRGSSVFIAINASIDYSFIDARRVIDGLTMLTEFCAENDVSLGIQQGDELFVANIFAGVDAYANDFETALTALMLDDKKECYGFVFDAVCTALDNDFAEKNYCDFDENSQCVANRAGESKRETMGCCWSFTFDKRGAPTEEVLCEFLDMDSYKCKTKCMACKLHTCATLKRKGFIFDADKKLLLASFFNKSQLSLLGGEFFVDKESMIEKLLNNEELPGFETIQYHAGWIDA